MSLRTVTPSLKTTFEVLSTSRNEAAVPVLIGALENGEEKIFEGALKSLVARRNRSGHYALLSRWHKLTEEQRELVREGRGRMTAALRDCILSDDDQTFDNAVDIVEEFSEFDLISTLVTLSENKSHKHAAKATTLVTQMANLLSEMVHGQRDKKDRRDPNMIRRHVLESLERSVERFRNHKRSELIEAFVVLGGSSSGLLRAIIENPRHVCYLTVVHTLCTSESTAVVRLLLGFLASEHASQASLTIISKRTDKAFLTQLLEFVDENPTERVKRNLRRIRNFAWLKDEGWSIDRLSEVEQRRFSALLSASGMDQTRVLDLQEELLAKGLLEGRIAACEALATVQGDRPSRLVFDALYDPEPLVQAAATRQLRDRRVAGAMNLLVKLLDSPHEVVRDAARESLAEFSLENFLRQFDGLDEESRRSQGELVAKADKKFTETLANELKSRSRKNRMRAIEIAEIAGMVRPMADALVQRLEDSDHLVRAAAAEVLQHCPTPEVQEALQLATQDRSPTVQIAAKSTLAAIAGLNASWETASRAESQV